MEELADLTSRDKLIGADHIADGKTALAISELRAIPLRTVERAIARVLAAIHRAGVDPPRRFRGARQVLSGFTPGLVLAL